MSTDAANSQNTHCTNENLKTLLYNAINRLNYLHLCTFKTPILEDKKICEG